MPRPTGPRPVGDAGRTDTHDLSFLKHVSEDSVMGVLSVRCVAGAALPLQPALALAPAPTPTATPASALATPSGRLRQLCAFSCNRAVCRFERDKIYSYIGNVLLCVNPFKSIKFLYGPATIRQYLRRLRHENAPHVYAIAEASWRHLLSTGASQCIVVGGESGTGKTEATKTLLEYVTLHVYTERAHAQPTERIHVCSD
jgi:hypothetical protein